MTLRKLRLAFGALLLGMSALAFAPAAHATIPEGAVVVGCVEVVPGFYSMIFYEGEIIDVLSDSCPLGPLDHDLRRAGERSPDRHSGASGLRFSPRSALDLVDDRS